MNRKEDYRDMEKYHKACQRQHRRYYSKTSFLYPSHPWTAEEDALVSQPDRHKTLHGTLTATLLDMTVNHKPQQCPDNETVNNFIGTPTAITMVKANV